MGRWDGPVEFNPRSILPSPPYDTAGQGTFLTVIALKVIYPLARHFRHRQVELPSSAHIVSNRAFKIYKKSPFELSLKIGSPHLSSGANILQQLHEYSNKHQHFIYNMSNSPGGYFPLGGSKISDSRATSTCYCGSVSIEFVRLHALLVRLGSLNA